ncbi:MAG: tetratricopeptide repeat protein [Acidobacteria bacterium]|nr:tetratricopeptide repeat protein [Acidobacteriota bacterium]
MADTPSLPTLQVVHTVGSSVGEDRLGRPVLPSARDRAEHDAGVPRQIGRYTITGVLGTGGMGVVYRAEQQEPLRRDVALKLVRRGLDTDRLIARFDAERATLARMNHPGIARVFDAGATDDGRPYVVMELVAGSPITDYCDEHRVPVRDRLSLFVATCRAVQHAHQKGIIHRDLKPSNILVAEVDGTLAPTVIDFGVAKVITDEGPERLLLTREGGAVGTPDYMSPEQAGVVDGDIDTRTDVYALGVVLYELLAGRRPHRFTTGTREEFQRVLRDGGTARPSAIDRSTRTMIDGAGPDAASWTDVAQARFTTPDRLRRMLAGDLDTIVLKAMAFAPARRYASVDHLADDVERYLRGQVVLARPDSWSYRARKFVARHRYGVAAAGLAATALVAISVVTSVQAGRVARERDRAEAALARASAVNAFLVNMFGQADPRSALGVPLTSDQMLERAATRLDTDLTDQPDVRAELLQALADVYKQLGRYPQSEALAARAVDLRRDGPPLVLAESLDALGDVRRYAGRLDAAIPPLEEALAIRERELPYLHRDIAETLNNMGLVRHAQARFADAEALQRQAVAIWEAVGARSEREDLVALGLTNLARSVRAQGRFEEATGQLERALALRRAHLPPNSPSIGNTLFHLGVTHLEAGHPDSALPLFEQATAIHASALGSSHSRALETRARLARTLARLGRYDEASREARVILDHAGASPSGGIAATAVAELVLADAAVATGRARKARDLLASARERYARTTPPADLAREFARLTSRLESLP